MYKIIRGLCYLAGLMQNFGLLLFGHWYPQHYATLSSLVYAVPGTDIRELEFITFDISHDTLGMELMRAWNMPEEIIVSIGEHKFPDYDGKHSSFVKLVALANRLLAHPVLENKTSNMITPVLLEKLQLSEEQAINALEKVQESMDEFSGLAKQLAA